MVGIEPARAGEGSPQQPADEVAAVSKPSSPAKDATPALPSPGSSLVPLRASNSNGSASTTSTVPALSMPHPKKFSHSDINKRFLEKNSPGSSASQTPSAPSLNKPGSLARTCLFLLRDYIDVYEHILVQKNPRSRRRLHIPGSSPRNLPLRDSGQLSRVPDGRVHLLLAPPQAQHQLVAVLSCSLASPLGLPRLRNRLRLEKSSSHNHVGRRR